MKQIDLIFTRDFSLFTYEFWRDVLLAKVIQDAWGVSLSDQIVHFNGKLIEAYRLRLEMDNIKGRLIHLPLDHASFTEQARSSLEKTVTELRGLLDEIEEGQVADQTQTWENVLRLFRAMYPGYMMANFLPGAWADDFRMINGPAAESVLKMQFANRLFVEGIFERTDLVLRLMVSHALEANNLDGTLARLVTFKEAEALVKDGKPPHEADLKARQAGYTLIAGRMILGHNLKQLLLDNGLEFDFPDVEGIQEFKGSPAFASPPLQGRVQILYTIEDVKSFMPGNILVMAMTSPDFLPAIKKAAAIITDEGGITCHAAIVSRELMIPCVIGTKIATKVLKDGMEVEVDATKGIVRIIK